MIETEISDCIADAAPCPERMELTPKAKGGLQFHFRSLAIREHLALPLTAKLGCDTNAYRRVGEPRSFEGIETAPAAGLKVYNVDSHLLSR